MNNIELENRIRQASIEHQARLQKANQQAQPDAPGCAQLPDAQRENARNLFGEAILARSPGTWTKEESDFIRASINATLRGMS